MQYPEIRKSLAFFFFGIQRRPVNLGCGEDGEKRWAEMGKQIGARVHRTL